MAIKRSPDRALLHAAMHGDLAEAKAALASGASPDGRAKDAMTPLSRAARGGHAPCVEELLAAGADPWARRGDGGSAVAAAMEKAGGASNVPAQWAIVEALLQAPARAAPPGKEGLIAAFKAAAAAGQLPAMKLLMAAGVEIDAPYEERGRNGMVPENFMVRAVRLRSEPMLRALLEAGAAPDAFYPRGYEQEKNCASLEAVEEGWVEGLRILMRAGADPHGPNGGRGGLAYTACERRSGSSHVEILSVLEEAGGDLTHPQIGHALLLRAAGVDDIEAVRWLCGRGLDPGGEDRPPGQASSLDLARKTPERPCAKLIIEFAAMAKERRDIAAAVPAGKQGAPRRRV